MSLSVAAAPLAFVAGVAGILSPCVWPLVPVVAASAASGGRSGPLYLAGGLSLSFALAGTLLTLAVVSLGLDPERFRYVAAVLLAVVGIVLLAERLSSSLTRSLATLTGRIGIGHTREPLSAPGQFGVGALLGIVWLPCVGPTLGAAIALASLGQELGRGFIVMLAYGVGTASVLLVAAAASRRLLHRWRFAMMAGGRVGRKVVGISLIALAIMVLTGTDKYLEALAVNLVPGWLFTW
jgi:cytochrome c-type biogenesis protein